MIKNLNFSGLLFLVVVLTIFVFSSCRKDKLGDVEKVHQETEIQTNSDLEFFLSREKTYDLLAPAAFNWERPINQVSNRNDEILELQTIITDINTQLNERYVTKLIYEVGYPLWDASVLQLLDDDGGYTLFTPVFKAGADKINALFIYTYSPNGKVAYSLTSREVMESNAAYLKDPNFLIKINLFQHFDELLFNYGPPIYEDWKVLAGNQNFIDCYAELIFRSEIGGPLIGDGVISCSDGCYDDIEESQAFDTQEEMAWIYGNCQYAGQFNKFLTDNANINSTQLNDATQFFIDLGMANNIISFQVYKGLMNEITTFFADPNDENIADLVEYFNDNNLDPLAFSTFTLNLLDPNLSASVPRLFWNDMNSGDYWGKSAQRRSDMIHDYES